MTDQLPTIRYHAAGGVIVDPEQDRVMVLLRPGRDGPDGRPEVRLPKGHIEAGETPLSAAQREVHEEAGLVDLEVVADLGRQGVEFKWKGRHIIRCEVYWLLAVTPGTQTRAPEKQFQRQWLAWDDALEHVSFAAEREWVRRARQAYEAARKRSGQGSD